MTLKFQIEPWERCREEMAWLFPFHDDKLNTLTGEPMAPNWEMYDQAAAAGTFYVITARTADDTIVGYHWSFLTAHPHHAHKLVAFTDTYFLHPDHRKGRNGLNLIKAAQSLLKGRGASMLYIGVRIDGSNNKSRLFERLGFKPMEMSYSVRL